MADSRSSQFQFVLDETLSLNLDSILLEKEYIHSVDIDPIHKKEAICVTRFRERVFRLILINLDNMSIIAQRDLSKDYNNMRAVYYLSNGVFLGNRFGEIILFNRSLCLQHRLEKLEGTSEYLDLQDGDFFILDNGTNPLLLINKNDGFAICTFNNEKISSRRYNVSSLFANMRYARLEDFTSLSSNEFVLLVTAKTEMKCHYFLIMGKIENNKPLKTGYTEISYDENLAPSRYKLFCVSENCIVFLTEEYIREKKYSVDYYFTRDVTGLWNPSPTVVRAPSLDRLVMSLVYERFFSEKLESEFINDFHQNERFYQSDCSSRRILWMQKNQTEVSCFKLADTRFSLRNEFIGHVYRHTFFPPPVCTLVADYAGVSQTAEFKERENKPLSMKCILS